MGLDCVEFDETHLAGMALRGMSRYGTPARSVQFAGFGEFPKIREIEVLTNIEIAGFPRRHILPPFRQTNVPRVAKVASLPSGRT